MRIQSDWNSSFVSIDKIQPKKQGDSYAHINIHFHNMQASWGRESLGPRRVMRIGPYLGSYMTWLVVPLLSNEIKQLLWMKYQFIVVLLAQLSCTFLYICMKSLGPIWFWKVKNLPRGTKSFFFFWHSSIQFIWDPFIGYRQNHTFIAVQQNC